MIMFLLTGYGLHALNVSLLNQIEKFEKLNTMGTPLMPWTHFKQSILLIIVCSMYPLNLLMGC